METAEILLKAGADPHAGFLWQGLTSPFTALTGAFGGGEQDQPAHPDAVPLARRLLVAGADPNDNQTLYNRMFRPPNDHLELLFSFGLGEDGPSPWRDRLGPYAYPSPTAMLGEQLRWAADHGYTDRVRLLLGRGVDPDTLGYHPNYGSQSAYALAVRAGHGEIATALLDAGASGGDVDEVDAFLGRCVAGEEAVVRARLAEVPELGARAVARRPDALAVAVERGHHDVVPLLISLGFPVDGSGPDGRTALHYAALAGDVELVERLLARGADPARRDRDYDATPAQWARHGRHSELTAVLEELAPG